MKNIKRLFLLVVLPLLSVSCIVDDVTETGLETNPYIVGFSRPLAAVSYFEDEGVVLENYKINVLGGNGGTVPSQDITISYSVDTENSTAVEGLEFDFVSSTGTVVIPAGSTFTDFPLNINTGGFDPDVRTILRIVLTATTDDGSVVSAIHDTLDITFVGCQSDVYLYEYNVVTTRLDNNQTLDRGTEVIYFESINNFRTATTATLGPNGQPEDTRGFDFTVLCGVIVIPSQGLFQGAFASNELVGIDAPEDDEDGNTVDEDGNFTLYYSANYGGATGVLNFRGVYTRL